MEMAGMDHKWWPWALQHFAFAHNIVLRDGDSPWNARHGDGHFKGRKLPLGCLVDFKPTPTAAKATLKFEPKAVPGIFLGYYLSPGGKWPGDYLVASLEAVEDFRKESTGSLRVHRIKEVVVEKGASYNFPSKLVMMSTEGSYLKKLLKTLSCLPLRGRFRPRCPKTPSQMTLGALVRGVRGGKPHRSCQENLSLATLSCGLCQEDTL